MFNGESLNLNWKFKDDFKPEYIGQEQYDDFATVHIPHTVKEIPYDCYDDSICCMVSTYVRFFTLPELTGKRVAVEFEGVSDYYDLYVNGQKAASHKGAYSTALYDITAYVHPGQNKLLLMVDSNERPDIPPSGSTVDYLIYGGIYRDVTLYVLNETYITRALFRYTLEGNCPTACPELMLDNGGEAFEGRVQVSLTRDGQPVCSYERTVTVPAGAGSITLEAQQLPPVELWDLDTPVLYDVEIRLFQGETLLDQQNVRVGFRTVGVKPDGFLLNGRKIKLIGLNRHQSYPYVGYAMGKRPQQRDADILKYELNVNMVRCSHYMQSRYFLDRCDELGLLVFEEIPGWGHLGDEAYKEVSLNDLQDMVLGHFNHPSIAIWGTRLNESPDDDEFYEKTNRLCKQMDPTRPTTGVRWHRFSPLFEDIYSYNDYTPVSPREPFYGEFMLQEPQAVTGLPYKVPFLISEHTAPLNCTKPGDDAMQQERLALYHASVLNKVMSNDGYLGALGWCMFDYNTHSDHSRQEKICYHGVMDMFRVPKWAAYLYRSQKDPEQEVVLQPCSVVGRGERTEAVTPFFVLTNCDYIDVTLSTDKTRRFYPSSRFPAMKHPPIEVNESDVFWQPFWEGSTIVGYVNQKEVARVVCGKNPWLADLDVKADDEELYCDRVDETRVVCIFRDTDGMRMLHHFGVGKITVEGDIELIGPDTVPVLGGAIAFWVKTKPLGRKGEAKVHVSACRPGLADKTITIRLI